jgi:antitoxin VapB
MARTAKLFRNGRSLAVRLPAEFRFEGTEVYIRRDPVTESWKSFFELADQAGVPDDFLSDRGDAPPQERDLF